MSLVYQTGGNDAVGQQFTRNYPQGQNKTRTYCLTKPAPVRLVPSVPRTAMFVSLAVVVW